MQRERARQQKNNQENPPTQPTGVFNVSFNESLVTILEEEEDSWRWDQSLLHWFADVLRPPILWLLKLSMIVAIALVVVFYIEVVIPVTSIKLPKKVKKARWLMAQYTGILRSWIKQRLKQWQYARCKPWKPPKYKQPKKSSRAFRLRHLPWIRTKFKLEKLKAPILQFSCATTTSTPTAEANSLNFDADSAAIKIGNCTSTCITNTLKNMVPLTVRKIQVPVKGFMGEQGLTAMIQAPRSKLLYPHHWA